MTEQEKELGIYIAECVNGLADSGDNFKDCFTLAKALIQRYPQILAEKVWEGDVREMILNNIDDGKYVSHSISITKPVEIFIKEVIE